jgi:hypothetical protein
VLPLAILARQKKSLIRLTLWLLYLYTWHVDRLACKNEIQKIMVHNSSQKNELLKKAASYF